MLKIILTNILSSKYSLHHEVKSSLVSFYYTGALKFYTSRHASIELKFVWDVIKSFLDKSIHFLLRTGTTLLAVHDCSFQNLLNLSVLSRN